MVRSSTGRNASQPLVLIGFAEADAAPEVAWSLIDAGARVAVFGRRGHRSPIRHSRFVTCHDITPPEESSHAAATDLCALMRQVSETAGDAAPILFPLDDTAVWLCDRVAQDSSWIMAGPRGEPARLALNKTAQIRLAQNSGMSVPPTIEAHRPSDVTAFAAQLGFPLVLKAAVCVEEHDGRRVPKRAWIVADQVELQHALSQWDARTPLLVQRFVTGRGEGVFGIRTPEGVRGWSGHRRLRMMNPHGSGASACVAQDVPPALRGQVETFLAAAGWRGLFMIEMLRDESGTAWFMELNGRPWGSMALARRQGLEYPAWHISLAQNDQSAAGRMPATSPGLVCRNVGRELMHLAFVFRGPKSSAPIQWPSFWRSLKDVATIGRHDGIYNWRASDWRVFVADVFATISKNVVKQGA
jgi:predicted ATP-grasp superfamily ATP-dependent carboligase